MEDLERKFGDPSAFQPGDVVAVHHPGLLGAGSPVVRGHVRVDSVAGDEQRPRLVLGRGEVLDELRPLTYQVVESLVARLSAPERRVVGAHRIGERVSDGSPVPPVDRMQHAGNDIGVGHASVLRK